MLATSSVLRAGLIGFAVFLSSVADGADQPISGAKLILTRTTSGREKLVFISRDPAFLFPAPGGPDDPSTGGARIELLAATAPGAAFDLPPGVGTPGWVVTDATIDRYRFANPDAPGGASPVKLAFLRQGSLLRVVGRGTGLSLAGGIDRLALRVTTGSLRSCALFDASSITVDIAGRFIARNAVAPAVADCTAQSLGVAECGDGVRQPGELCDGGDDAACPGLCQADCACGPFCGDGIVNQASEQCDGEARSGACPLGFGCTPLCTCCTQGAFCNLTPCCSGADICVPSPNEGFCWSTSCEPPFTCEAGAECGPGNACCMPLGSNCFLPYIGCCPGLTCAGSPGGLGFCCGGAGYTCTGNGDCCSGTCDGGTCAP
jgi:hypothetical protein